MKRYDMRLSRDALRDLRDIYDYIAEHDSAAKAELLMERVAECVDKLETHPARGSHPRELSGLGYAEYRQVFFKPYRIIYLTEDTTVYILLVADGCRDMRTLLEHRLLDA